MITFTQINLHKARQATTLVAEGLKGTSQTVVLMTEPYTMAGNITGMPRGTKTIYDRTKGGHAPRAGIVASKDMNLTAMDNWCKKDCAVALAKINGRHTVLISLCLLYTSPSPRDRQKSRMPSSA